MATEFDQAFDVWMYNEFAGTIGLVDGDLVFSGDQKTFRKLVKTVRESRDVKTDEDIFKALPDVFHGVVSLRAVGNKEGLDAPAEIKDES